MRVIAKLDVKSSYVIKPIHFEGLRKIGEPEPLAKQYYEQGADEIFYLDIVASLYRREILFDQITKTAKDVFVPFAVGGGVRTLDDMCKLFHCGADKIVINTYALQNDPNIIDKAAHLFGSQSLVVNIEAKRWDSWVECYSDCGRERSGKDVLEWAVEVQERGAGEVLLQSVDRDGRRSGFDIDLIHSVKDKLSIPLVAASGAGSLEDIRQVYKQATPDAVAIASLLYYGNCDIRSIKTMLAEEMKMRNGI